MSHLTKCANWVGLICIIFLLASCNTGSSYSKRHARTSKSAKGYHVSPNETWRPKKRHTIPVVMNSRVRSWVKKFNGPLKNTFTRWIRRIGHYGPTIEKVLKSEGAPPDLIYLAMIESGFNLSAYSHAAASGPWQFISSTGKMYGLNNGFFIDERRDLVQATRAAARHLKDLYKIYGNWYLAFAAYNAGVGKVNGAIKRGRTKDYWRLSSHRSRHLRQETKDYVPKILAALHIVKNYRKYGYSHRNFGDPIQYEQVTVPDATDVNVIAKSANTSVHTIRSLNPNLVVGITPPGQRFAIYIPKGAKEEFVKNYARIPSSKRVSHLQYRAGYKETISTIAKKYNVSASRIARLNGYKTKQKLRAGTIIKIPASKATLLAMAKTGYSYSSRSKKTKVVYYRVRPGDTLSRIARKNKTSTSKVAKWNRLKKNSKLRIGQKLKIYKKVKKGKYSSGKFVASRKNKSRTRVSGIAHIIMQDTNNPIDFKPSKYNKIDIPQMIAQADEFSSYKNNQPAMIKSLNGEVFGDPNLGNTKSKNNNTKPKKKKVFNKYHIVKPGDSLSTIAAKYDLRISELKTINRLKSDTIRTKQKLLVKKSSSIRTTKVTKPIKKLSNKIYVVKPNDSLYGIALRNKVTVAQIKSWNGLKSDSIRSGKKLKILRGMSTKKYSSSHNRNKVIFHYVKSGETLWSLSKKYNVKISDIMKWNKLKNDQVRPKQKIKIIAALNKPRKTASL